MSNKEFVLSQIKNDGLVAIVRTENREQALKTFEACVAGGVTAIEISLTVTGALELVQELSGRYKSDKVILGAGTVLDPETAKLAILSGAQYIISPYLNTAIVKLCNRYRIACIPGAMTVKEVAECMEAGADMVKVFPAELFGPPIIRAIKGPLPHAELMPTGGVSVENVGEWFKAGAAAVGVGGNLIAGAKQGDYDLVTRTAREFVKKIKELRKRGGTHRPHEGGNFNEFIGHEFPSR